MNSVVIFRISGNLRRFYEKSKRRVKLDKITANGDRFHVKMITFHVPPLRSVPAAFTIGASAGHEAPFFVLINFP